MLPVLLEGLRLRLRFLHHAAEGCSTRTLDHQGRQRGGLLNSRQPAQANEKPDERVRALRIGGRHDTGHDPAHEQPQHPGDAKRPPPWCRQVILTGPRVSSAMVSDCTFHGIRRCHLMALTMSTASIQAPPAAPTVAAMNQSMVRG